MPRCHHIVFPRNTRPDEILGAGELSPQETRAVRRILLLQGYLADKKPSQILPSEFVEVIGEEASRHSQLVCHVRSERSVTAIRVLVITPKPETLNPEP